MSPLNSLRPWLKINSTRLPRIYQYNNMSVSEKIYKHIINIYQHTMIDDMSISYALHPSLSYPRVNVVVDLDGVENDWYIHRVYMRVLLWWRLPSWSVSCNTTIIPFKICFYCRSIYNIDPIYLSFSRTYHIYLFIFIYVLFTVVNCKPTIIFFDSCL